MTSMEIVGNHGNHKRMNFNLIMRVISMYNPVSKSAIHRVCSNELHHELIAIMFPQGVYMYPDVKFPARSESGVKIVISFVKRNLDLHSDMRGSYGYRNRDHRPQNIKVN